MSELERINATLKENAPGVWAALSALGRDVVYPPDIPFQAAQAKGTRYNATIGQITDGAGSVLRLDAIEDSLRLNDEDRNKALLYSPIGGLDELRTRWERWQRPEGVNELSPPLVTIGLTHGLALVADLFAGEGTPVVVPQPSWGNYRQVFGLRRGARMISVDAYRKPAEDRFDWRPEAIAEAIAALPAGTPAIAILNLPSNPGGYMPTVSERGVLAESLVAAAADRPVVVVCDDAYAGLVYDAQIPAASMFWDLIGQHDNLLPIRLAGSTKEFLLFGGRVGFLTLPFAAGNPVADALDNKLRGLVRSGVGSPAALSQVVLLQALRNAEIGEEVEEIRALLGRRRARLAEALERAATDSKGRLRPLPANAGAFALIELDESLDAGELRLRLIEESDVGLVSIGDRYLRIAFCSLAEEDVDLLVSRLVAAAS
ncbi:MAG: aminotransferase class I/II-fold pyridoxal phosphate-dependent enzyme [Acidobacteriota bacterium]